MDLVTALGRLLHDGALRDEFAAQPLAVAERLKVRATDRPALLALSVADLEFQAGILSGKRFDLIQGLIPRTLAALERPARATFFAYARNHWPHGPNQPVQDAAEFCRYCEKEKTAPVCRAELNRLHFALNQKTFAAHIVRNPQPKNRRALQILWRQRAGWRELVLYLDW